MIIALAACAIALSPVTAAALSPAGTQTAESQAALTPDAALALLREGNQRFVSGKMMERDLQAQVAATAGGQFPHSIVLACIDSRVPPEVVFDQGIGDIFAPRVAGNFVDGELLGSMEEPETLEALAGGIEVDGGGGCFTVHRATSASAAYRFTGRCSGRMAAMLCSFLPMRPSGIGASTVAVDGPS